MITDSDALKSGIVSFGSYASNGRVWEKVSTLKRYVQYATNAYYSNGAFHTALPVGSYVWLDARCTKGATNENYIAVTAIQPKGGAVINYSGNGFIDLINGHYLNVSSILLRKA